MSCWHIALTTCPNCDRGGSVLDTQAIIFSPDGNSKPAQAEKPSRHQDDVLQIAAMLDRQSWAFDRWDDGLNV